MKKLGLLIIVVSFIGASIPGFAVTPTKAKPSVKEQTTGGGEAPCPCLTSGKPKKVSREQSGTLAAGQDEKAKDATGAMGSSAGEQIQKDKTKK